MLLKLVARICVRTFFRGLGSPVGEKKLETKKINFGYACIKLIDHCRLDTVPLRGGRAAMLQRRIPCIYVRTFHLRGSSDMGWEDRKSRNKHYAPLRKRMPEHYL